ncbi:MAG TPA: hypothetical protein VEB20_03725 [Azospirillaceae bacterium]|nr:hypothetical protein [Azospirillaceae bacterium]
MPSPVPPAPQTRFHARAAAARGLALLLAAGAALGGCADRPPAASFLAYPQQRLASAAHWQVIADDIASAVSAHLMAEAGQNQPGAEPGTEPAAAPAAVPVAAGRSAVAAPAVEAADFSLSSLWEQGPPVPRPPVQVYMMRHEDTVFADSFMQALTTAFVRRGHAVAVDSRPDVVTVGIDVQVIRHEPGRGNRTVPGPVTALGAGVAVARLLVDNVQCCGMMMAGLLAAAGADAVRATVPETDTELVMTVSLAKDGFFTYRSGAVYYVDDREAWHYQGFGDPRQIRSLNDLPDGSISYDIAGQPYVSAPAPTRGARR